MKIMRSNLLKLSVLLTILATNAAFRWQLGIANYTKAIVDLKISYVWSSCSADSVRVQPGQIIHVDAGFGCLVDDITGTATLNGKAVALTKDTSRIIGGRDFSINIIEIRTSISPETNYQIQRV